jgi:hypothetical protein
MQTLEEFAIVSKCWVMDGFFEGRCLAGGGLDLVDAMSRFQNDSVWTWASTQRLPFSSKLSKLPAGLGTSHKRTAAP